MVFVVPNMSAVLVLSVVSVTVQYVRSTMSETVTDGVETVAYSIRGVGDIFDTADGIFDIFPTLPTLLPIKFENATPWMQVATVQTLLCCPY